jgi:hypothetical protein
MAQRFDGRCIPFGTMMVYKGDVDVEWFQGA